MSKFAIILLLAAGLASTVNAQNACKSVRQQSQNVPSTNAINAPAGDAGTNTLGGGYTTSTGQLQARGYVTFCVPALASQQSGLQIKVRCDNGVAGTLVSGTDPSYVLTAGQCVPCYVSASIIPTAIAVTDGGGQLDTTECAP